MTSILKYITLSALLLCAAACTKPDDSTKSEPQPIEISPQVEAFSKALDNAFVLGDKIGVYVSRYNGATVQPLQSTGNYANHGDNVAFSLYAYGWDSSPATLYWMPNNSDKIDMYGYYPYHEGITDALAVKIEVQADQNAAASDNNLSGYEASDFMYAKSSSAIEHGSPVSDQLTFKHKLSKVIVKLESGADMTEELLARAIVTLNGTKPNSVINLGTGALTEASGEVRPITMRKNGTAFDAVVVPQSVTGLDLLVIEVDGKTYNYNTSFTFVENNSHTFTITVSRVAISVTSNSINGWTPDQEPSTGEAEGEVTHGTAPYMSGSFIQSWLLIGWDEVRCEQEVQLLKSVGINDIIIDQVLWYYEEGATRKYLALLPIDKTELGITEDLTVETGNALERLLKACKKYDMGIYVGLNYDSRYWGRTATDRTALLQQAQMGNVIMDKVTSLYDNEYGANLKGWYWSWEINNVDCIENSTYQNQTLVKDMLAININHRNNNPKLNKPFMLSPFMNPDPGMDGMHSLAYRGLWVNILEQVDFRHGDILAPQDCMGTGSLNLQTAGEWLGNLALAAATKPGMEFWVNTEIFTPGFTSASVSDVIKRLELDSQFGSRLISFAYSHYYSPLLNSSFQTYHDAYKQYYDAAHP